MLVRNHTPFKPLLFQSRDGQSVDSWVVILKGTFRIVPHEPLALHEEQQELVYTDVFHEAPHTSSIYRESDLAPFKARTDIHVNAIARAPGGRPHDSWLVSVRVGVLAKTLRVTGPRQWVKQNGSFHLSQPEPCVEVPIRYEHAFGGVWKDNWGSVEVFQENPVGVGYVKPGEEPNGDFAAPRIESCDDPITELGKNYRPQGLGPLNRSWLPRRALAGTFDDKWKVDRWPELPLDFDESFYNGAHPDLIYPGYIEGDEEVTLEGLHEQGPVRFSLPARQVAMLVQFDDASYMATRFAADMVQLDVTEDAASIVWRARMTAERGINTIDILMKPAD